MNNTITIDRHELKTFITEAMREVVSPFISLDEMMRMYSVKCHKTIRAMELRGDIPCRTKSGYWLRSEVNECQALRRAA